MTKEIEKVSVDEITIYRTVSNKIAVKRSDRIRPSRYFNNVKEARDYVKLHFEGNITETL